MSSGSIGQGNLTDLQSPTIQFVPMVLFEWDEQKEVYVPGAGDTREVTHLAVTALNPTYI